VRLEDVIQIHPAVPARVVRRVGAPLGRITPYS
jgi:hypothetical protein